MLSLRKLQETMAAELLSPERPGVAAYARGHCLSGVRRLRVYRNNVAETFRAALGAMYPVVRRLVGEEFFRSAARRFQHSHPSTSGNLNDAGYAFPWFLQDDPAAAQLPYLADVARLECTLHEISEAPEPAASDLAELASIPAGRIGDFRLRLHPAARIVCSTHPVFDIWRANQADRDGTVDITGRGPQRLLVQRDGGGFGFTQLDEAAFVFLNAIDAGHSARCAADLALRVDPDFRMNRALDQFRRRRTITACFQ